MLEAARAQELRAREMAVRELVRGAKWMVVVVGACGGCSSWMRAAADRGDVGSAVGCCVASFGWQRRWRWSFSSGERPGVEASRVGEVRSGWLAGPLRETRGGGVSEVGGESGRWQKGFGQQRESRGEGRKKKRKKKKKERKKKKKKEKLFFFFLNFENLSYGETKIFYFFF